MIMYKKALIIILSVFVIFYLLEPVPYCKISNKQISGNSIYTSEQIMEVKNITAILLNVIGTSMLPTIQDNSQCLCIQKERYLIGDIIFFFANINNEIHGVSHRIMKIDNGDIYTKGDNNDWIDPPMTKENIVCSIPNIPRYKVLFNFP